MNAHARRENIALVKAWRKSVFADRERVGAVHRTDQDWLAVDLAGRIVGSFAEEKAAVRALLDVQRRSA